MANIISIAAIAAALLLAASSAGQSHAENYGVDVSFPIHNKFIAVGGERTGDLSQSRSVFGEDRIKTYETYIAGCEKHYGRTQQAHLCQEGENSRFEYNTQQPRGVKNHTDIGFRKTRLSDETWTMLQEFWSEIRLNHDNDKKREEDGLPFPDGLPRENWPTGNIYVNHWAKPTHHTSVQINQELTEAIWRELESKMRLWIPHAQIFTRSDIYGIRVYRNGHILAPHVDRDPLVSSAIINVDQDGLAEPWPLEVYDHEGVAHNITIEPGEIILYESHSVIHGRPFALKGDYYANIFVHFKPHFEGFEDYYQDETEGEL
eukprot:CAMPEP_0183712682 /NCGR_PEP_ID=MMETSP0737-20130205/7752_1 /TAXON_ID=385413 /ORGANISM="Thalassiosira miniscula, Strain CCMP1093" /LENGTH=317 /DNA_ID=CAMNT_0025941341 /DNA_START=51 /DNA_END=1004 /DNA_ORIENTATION=+